MAQYRKRAVVVEATQFDGHNDPAGVFRRPEDGSPYVVTVHDQRCYIVAGDWILPEPDGVHFYPCKPEIFAATYEAVAAVPAPSSTPTPTAPAPTEHILQFFAFEHLPPVLAAVSRPFCELARMIVAGGEMPAETAPLSMFPLPRNPQRDAALSKLLEAKDAAVRALVAKP